MGLRTEDINFLETWRTQPYSSETKNRLKEIFSRAIDHGNSSTLDSLAGLFKCSFLPPELPMIIATIPYNTSYLSVQRTQQSLAEFVFKLNDAFEKTQATLFFEKRIEYITCRFDIPENLDPNIGDRPLTRLAIRIAKEIFKRASENRLVAFVQSGHIGPVVYAEGFSIQNPAISRELQSIHLIATTKGNSVGRNYCTANTYQADLFKSFEILPPLIKGDFSLL